MRYKFYREHKYVSFALNNVERLIARTDFCVKDQVTQVKEQFELVIQMLMGHAGYEDTMLHSLLKKKNSDVYKKIEDDHTHLDKSIQNLRNLLNAVQEAQSNNEKIEAGYQFYLWYRKFVGDNLIHLHEEETIILPELQRLYSDDELAEVEAATYKEMTAEQMIDMVRVLFPHMNSDDHRAFLSDIKRCQPTKFSELYKVMDTILSLNELAALNI